MEGIAREPRIVGRGPGGYAPYDLYLDSPLGYELQAGGFETREEIAAWIAEHYPDHEYNTPSLW